MDIKTLMGDTALFFRQLEPGTLYPVEFGTGYIPTRKEFEGLVKACQSFYDQITDAGIEDHNQTVKAKRENPGLKVAIAAPPEIPGYVYLLKGDHGYFKIGRTQDLSNRAKQLGTKLPFKTELIHSYPTEDCVASEKSLHERFADKQVEGEWFKLDSADVEWIKKL